MNGLALHGCIFDGRTGRCGKAVLPRRALCAEHITTVCECGRQAVRECSQMVGPKVCGRPTCTRCKCSVHSALAQEPRIIVYAR